MKIADVITNKIGQIAKATPSSAPVAMMPASLPKGTTATMNEIIAATPQAFHAGTFKMDKATISHNSGSTAKIPS